MNIFGIDFTSAPRRRKPITLAAGILNEGRLTIRHIRPLMDFTAFESWLDIPGPWVAGMDFPFGQPRRLIDDLGWPPYWEEYVSLVGEMTKAGFEDLLRVYRDGQPRGKKHHYRETDQMAGARSPMMLYGVPVGRMFFEGAPRLLRAGVSVLPCRPTKDDRLVFEVYPALAACRWISRAPYKSDTKSRQTQFQKRNRARILKNLSTDDGARLYGLDVVLEEGVERSCVEDPTGDYLDAVLSALQAAWAYSQKEHNFGIPEKVDACEGWIVDPVLLT